MFMAQQKRKRLATHSVTHPATGDIIEVVPMDDGTFDILIEAGKVWAIFNHRTGVDDGTRIGLTPLKALDYPTGDEESE